MDLCVVIVECNINIKVSFCSAPPFQTTVKVIKDMAFDVVILAKEITANVNKD